MLQTSSIAAIAHLGEMVGPNDAPETVQLLRERIAARPAAMWEKLGRPGDDETPAEQYRRLRLKTLDVERNEVLKIRSSGTVDHDIIEEVLGSFDIEESMLTIATERSDRLAEEAPVTTPTHRWSLRSPRARSRADQSERPGHLRGLHPRRHAYGAPAHLPQLRERRMLQLLGWPACRAPFHTDPTSGHAQLRAGRVVALVLHRRADWLTATGAPTRYFVVPSFATGPAQTDAERRLAFARTPDRGEGFSPGRPTGANFRVDISQRGTGHLTCSVSPLARIDSSSPRSSMSSRAISVRRRELGDRVGYSALQVSITPPAELLDERVDIVPVSADKMVNKLETPGLFHRKMISRPESVTADLILRMLIAGSSSSSMMPVGDDSDLLIFVPGSARSAILPTEGRMYGSGTTNVRPVAGVEACRQITGELKMLPLVLPHRYLISLVQQDVGSHQHRIGEQAHVCGLRSHLGGLVLELGHPLGLAEAGDAPEDPAELGMFGHLGLKEHSGFCRVDPCGKQLRGSAACAPATAGSVATVSACRSAIP